MAELLIEQGAQTVGIIGHQDEWSALISKSFATRFEELGGAVLVQETLPVGANDFRTTIAKAQNTDALYAPLVADLGLFFRQTEQLGYTGIVTTGDSMTADSISDAQGAAEGVYYTQVFVDESAQFQNLVDRYKAKFGYSPELPEFTALGYDGVHVVAEAIRVAGIDSPTAVNAALLQIKDLEGAAGRMSFDEDGFTSKLERIFVVKAGAQELLSATE